MNDEKKAKEEVGQKPTAAMKRYMALIEQGYSIKAKMAPDRHASLSWAPFLMDPDGKVVKRVSWAMAIKLEDAGYVPLTKKST